MSVELAEFHEIYFAECLENIDILQVGVAQLTAATVRGEAMDSAYRAAHSIKGASAIFGFQPVVESAQALEIMLDQIRSDKRELTPEVDEMLGQSIIRLQQKLETLRVEQALDISGIERQREALRREQGLYSVRETPPPAEAAPVPRLKNTI